MGTVNLYDGFDNTLLYFLHAVELFIENSAGFLRINGFKIIALPLNIHHNGQGPLGVTLFLRGYFMGAGHRQVSSGPELNIVRKCTACTGHEISDALETGQLHVVADLVLIFIRFFLGRRVAGKKPVDHKLQKAVLCGKLGAAAKGCLPNLVYGISVLPVGTGQAYVDLMLAQPFDQAHKTGVNQKNIRVEFSVFFLEFKGRLLGRVREYAAGMMLPLTLCIVKQKNRLLRAGLCAISAVCSIGTLRLLRGACRGAVKIEYWHVVTPLSIFRNNQFVRNCKLTFFLRSLYTIYCGDSTGEHVSPLPGRRNK